MSCTAFIGILGQVWYLIVSIPDLCTITYFDCMRNSLVFLSIHHVVSWVRGGA